MNPEDIDKEMYNNFILILSQVVLNIWRGEIPIQKFKVWGYGPDHKGRTWSSCSIAIKIATYF